MIFNNIRLGLVLICFGFALSSTHIYAKSKVLKSKKDVPHLLELFTSEGCSSCPPADDWYVDLKKHGKAFIDYIPVAYHVDYWNYIGWTDVFSSPRLSNLQRSYARIWKSSTVATPSIVLNGKLWRGWRSNSLPPKVKIDGQGKLSVHLDGDGNGKVVFKGLKTGMVLKAHIAVLGLGIKRHIKAGENAGRTLKHEFVALSHQTIPLVAKQKKYSKNFSYQLKSPSPLKAYAIAIWIREAGSLKPLQAVGSYL
ncbi:MAG: DUF1223 domain-containing protein [Oligoflexales bacterium]